MKKLLLLLLCVGFLHTGPVFGWGREGHETIAKIAERNLTKKAKKRIEKYLGGHSVVYYAKWMDEYRKTPEYAFTDGWHTAPIDAGLRYADELLMEAGGNPPGPPGPAAVKALVVKGRRRFFGLFGREPDTLIPWEEIAVIGEDAVFVKGVPTPPPGK